MSMIHGKRLDRMSDFVRALRSSATVWLVGMGGTARYELLRAYVNPKHASWLPSGIADNYNPYTIVLFPCDSDLVWIEWENGTIQPVRQSSQETDLNEVTGGTRP